MRNRMLRIRFILIFVQLLAAGTVFSQESEIINKLGEKQFLTNEGQFQLKLFFDKNEGKIPSNLIVVNFLTDAFYLELFYRATEANKIEKKIKQEDPLLKFSFSHGGLFGSPDKDYKSLIHPKRSVMGATRTRTLEELKNLQLISDFTYKETKAKLTDSTVRNEVDLLMLVKSKEEYFVNYQEYKAEELSFARDLVSQELISYSVYQKIRNNYIDLELKGKPEILSCSQKCKIVDLHSIEPNPDSIYTYLFKEIESLITDFRYSDLKVKLIEIDEDSDLIEQRLEISFSIKGKTYKNEFFHDFKRVRNFKKHHKNDESNKISSNFHKGINKYLRDIEANYRLHTINIKDNRSVYGQEKIGLIVLNEKQFNFLNTESYFLSDESYDNRFNSKGVDKIIKDFKSTGLFSHLSEEDIAMAKTKIESKEVIDFNDILFEYPHTIVAFDWETGNLTNPYHELTLAFSKASRNAFTPTEIKDDFEVALEKQRKVNYSFMFNDKVYSAILDMQDDWLDPKFMELIEKAMKENNVNGQFYFCYDNGQETGFIFLDKEQYEFINENYSDLIVKYE